MTTHVMTEQLPQADWLRRRLPTTAELREMRRSLAPAFIDQVDAAATRQPGASHHERKQGIGYRLSNRGNLIWSAYDRGQEARREAAAMRSRAFAQMDQSEPWGPGDELGGPWLRAR